MPQRVKSRDSLSTAYRWIKSDKLKESFKTIGNHRRFNLSEIKNIFINSSSNDNKLTVLYSRVSSHDQKQDLITQQQKLLNYVQLNNFTNIKLISDLGSGLNYKKSGLNTLLQLTLTHDVIELMTVFSAKLYGKRSHKNKLKFT